MPTRADVACFASKNVSAERINPDRGGGYQPGSAGRFEGVERGSQSDLTGAVSEADDQEECQLNRVHFIKVFWDFFILDKKLILMQRFGKNDDFGKI